MLPGRNPAVNTSARRALRWVPRQPADHRPGNDLPWRALSQRVRPSGKARNRGSECARAMRDTSDSV